MTLNLKRMNMQKAIVAASAETLADLYASGLSDQYGIKWLRARAAALGYSVEIKKRGPRNLYRFHDIDDPNSDDPTIWVTLPNARDLLDHLPCRFAFCDLPASIVDAARTVGYWPNPTALCDRMIEKIVAYAAMLPETSDQERIALFQRVPIAETTAV